MRNNIVFLCSGDPSLLNDFPEPKDLLFRTLAHSLGLANPSHLIQYNCTDGEVKVSP